MNENKEIQNEKIVERLKKIKNQPIILRTQFKEYYGEIYDIVKYIDYPFKEENDQRNLNDYIIRMKIYKYFENENLDIYLDTIKNIQLAKPYKKPNIIGKIEYDGEMIANSLTPRKDYICTKIDNDSIYLIDDRKEEIQLSQYGSIVPNPLGYYNDYIIKEDPYHLLDDQLPIFLGTVTYFGKNIEGLTNGGLYGCFDINEYKIVVVDDKGNQRICGLNNNKYLENAPGNFYIMLDLYNELGKYIENYKEYFKKQEKDNSDNIKQKK